MKDYNIIVTFDREPSTEFLNGYMAGRAAERLDREAGLIKSFHEQAIIAMGSGISNDAIDAFRSGGNTSTGDGIVKVEEIKPAKKEKLMVIDPNARKPVVGQVYAFNKTATDLREVTKVYDNGDVTWKRHRVVGFDSGNRHLSGSMSGASWRTMCKGAYVQAM